MEFLKFSELNIGDSFYFPYISKAPKGMKGNQTWIKMANDEAVFITPKGNKATIHPRPDWKVCRRE